MANKKNILALAKFIEDLQEEKFGMESCLMKEHSTEYEKMVCGSPSCIAGWAAWEQQGRPKFIEDNQEAWSTGRNNLINSALEYFGIPLVDWDERRRVANHLFRGDYGDGDNKRLTKADAVHALRAYAANGTIEWPLHELD